MIYIPITLKGQTYSRVKRLYNSIYPIQIKPYIPPQTKKQVDSKDEEQQTSESSAQRQGNSQASNPYNAVNPDGKSSYPRHEYPNGKKSTIDYSKSQVNIAQILTDFKSTALAIGSPPNILQEVEQYLSLAETESLKNEPNKKLIQSNLKNASSVLDKFISVTLDKKSKVVENWIDALFLQQVNYKSDPTTINEDFLVKLPDKETGDLKPISKSLVQPQPETSQEKPAEVALTKEDSKNIYIPADETIKNSLIQGKKLATSDPAKAKEIFMSAMEKAIALGELNAEGIACFELGRIFDKEDNLSEALKFYHQSSKTTSDNNLKAKSLYHMAQIYNDVVYFEPAMEHYFAAISYAGEAENPKAQTIALADIGQLYAERYDVNHTYYYYNIAKDIANETHNNKLKGTIWARSGDSLAMLNENINALKDYKESSKFFENTNSDIKMAKNYEKASYVMKKLGNIKKAKSLLETAQKIALNTDDIGYASILEKQLALFN